MKQNKPTATTGPSSENKFSSNRPVNQSNTAAKVTATSEDFHDNIDHCQEELQQVGLLACELAHSKREIQTITTRLSALVPNIMVKSHHQKSFDSDNVSAEARNATTAARAMKKMLRNGENNNTGLSGDIVDLESSDKETNKSRHKTICCVVLLMALSIVAALVVFFCYSPQVLDKEDRCLYGDKPFHNYKLFSTKTLYTSALNSMGKPPAPLSSIDSTSLHKNQNYDKSSTNVPKVFSSHESLEDIHKRLTIMNQCRVRQFHFFGRHAARTPDSEDIKANNKYIRHIISRIDPSRYENANPKPTGETPLDVQKTDSMNVSEVVCDDPLALLAKWKNYADPEDGNMVTQFGFIESEAIAKRFKSIYPELFNGKNTTIEFGTTDEPRTAQTAFSFLRHIDNSPDVGCDIEPFPVPINPDGGKVVRIKDSECLNRFLEKHHKDILKFHKQCKLSGYEPTLISHNYGVKDDATTSFIAKSVSRELQLSDPGLSSNETRAIYDICRYETAQTGQPSDWCRLFTPKDLKFYEYLGDVLDFLTDAYGITNQAQSACIVTKDLLDAFILAKKSTKPLARFYFTHSSAIQRLIAASIDLQADPAYKKISVLNSLKSGEVPEERQWRSSLLSPFSANIAFTLYDCGKPPLVQQNKEPEFNASPFYVVASINEQPITMNGCEENVCEFNQMRLKSRLLKNSNDCDLETICRFKTVVS